jgi:hypothetical protein
MRALRLALADLRREGVSWWRGLLDRGMIRRAEAVTTDR